MYQVEQIVNKRSNPQTNTTQYLVKWCGYSQKDNTWQLETHLKFVKNLINKFNQKSTIKNCLPHYENIWGEDDYQIKSLDFYVRDEKKHNGVIYEEEDNSDKKINKQKQQKQISQQQQPQPTSQSPSPPIPSNNPPEYPIPKQPSIDKPPPPPLPPPPQKLDKQKYLLREVQIKKQQITHISLPDRLNKKIPPPLPPDFTLNKDKYNQLLIKKSQQLLKTKLSNNNTPPPSKHKIIQKSKTNNHHQITTHHLHHPKNIQHISNTHRIIPSHQHSYHPNSKFQHLETPLTNNTHFRPYEKIIPPPPPPPRTSELYQYHQQGKKQYVLPESIKNSGNYWQNQEDSEYHATNFKNNNNPQLGIIYQYQTQNQQKITHKYPSQPNPTTTTTFYQPPYSTIQTNNLIVYSVTGMHKVGTSYIYTVQSNQGQLQLMRNDMVPRFSTELVEFYQRFLTIEE